jgi:ribosomal protein L40E
MGKGQKTCEKCGATTGPRAYMCPKCNAPFVFKAKSKEAKNTKIIRDFNWKELVMR